MPVLSLSAPVPLIPDDNERRQPFRDIWLILDNIGHEGEAKQRSMIFSTVLMEWTFGYSNGIVVLYHIVVETNKFKKKRYYRRHCKFSIFRLSTFLLSKAVRIGLKK